MSAGQPRRRVVVTGIGVVSPIGTGVGVFADHLRRGMSGIGPIKHFDASALPVQIAGEIHDFDPADYLSSKEIRRLDRFCHFGLAASDLALDDADLDAFDRDRAATVIGSVIGGVATMEDNYQTHLERPGAVSPFFIPASMVNMASSAIARRYRLRGPTHTTVSACASSADAVGQGYRLVRDGYASMCLAGGTEACLTSYIVSGFANIRALSRRNDAPELASRPFDAGRDGFVIAEGAAVLVLEPAEAAVSRGAHVYAELCGYGQTNDAFHETAPDPEAAQPARAMSLALDEAGLHPTDVTYINAHGTSTRFSDVSETRAIRRTFGTNSAQLAVSSTKSMTGHLLGAAGAVEAAACAIAIDGGWIPPTINYTQPDPECDLDYVPNTTRTCAINAALSNSLAFGGHNVSLAFRSFTGDESHGS